LYIVILLARDFVEAKRTDVSGLVFAW